MKIEQIERKAEQLRTMHWLEDILKKYIDMANRMEREGKYFTIQGIKFTARGEGECFELNPHRTIPTSYVKAGLVKAIEMLREEIAELKQEIENDTENS